MRRDMDLIRAIMLQVEAAEDDRLGVDPDHLSIEGRTTPEIATHVRLLVQAGLLEGQNTTSAGDETWHFSSLRLTWAGCEFLDAARDDTRWGRARDQISQVGSITLPLLLQLLMSYLRQELGLPGEGR
ncbi:MAG: DUF2513 domain-containing protein [Phycisphaeraceae bacterium]